jgi:hypothetical protein
MKFMLALMLICSFQAAESGRQQFDLEGMLRDEAALQKLKIAYFPPARENNQRFFVYGDGSVIWQAYPRRSMSLALIPTCRNKVSTEAVKDLVRLIIEGRQEIEFHTIAIDDGVGAARKTFAIGEFAGERESLPPGFLAIEKELQRIKESALPHDKITCHFAPAIVPRD